jgi:hypothetical protein
MLGRKAQAAARGQAAARRTDRSSSKRAQIHARVGGKGWSATRVGGRVRSGRRCVSGNGLSCLRAAAGEWRTEEQGVRRSADPD